MTLAGALRASLTWLTLRPDRAALEPAQALQHVLRPADGLSKLPVADHIDAGFGLPAHDIGDRSGQAMIVCLRVKRFARLLGTQKLLQRLRPNQAADMGREDAINASFHLVLRARVKMVRPSSSHRGHCQIARLRGSCPPAINVCSPAMSLRCREWRRDLVRSPVPARRAA